jgi:hypothetical protein
MYRMVKLVVERSKTLPPPNSRTGPPPFFGNGGGCFHSSKNTKKGVAFGHAPRILFLVQSINQMQSQAEFIAELNRNANARFKAQMFKFLLDTAHHSLPFTVTAEQEAAFKAALAERVARVEMQANETFAK